jgi:hypothetical protein
MRSGPSSRPARPASRIKSIDQGHKVNKKYYLWISPVPGCLPPHPACFADSALRLLDLQTHHIRGNGAKQPRFMGHMAVTKTDIGVTAMAQGEIIINRVA